MSIPDIGVPAQRNLLPQARFHAHRQTPPASLPSSSPPFSIVHISDPHLSRQYYREHLKSFKLLLRSVLERGCDHLIITGDIVSTADPEDYFLAREILSRFGFLDGRKLTVVPGNHDIFGGPHKAVDVLSFPRHIRSVDYHRNLTLFREAFHEAFDGAHFLCGDKSYPFLKQVGPFSILGLNSIPPWSLWSNILGTNGSLDEHQFDSLRALAGSPSIADTIPIAAIHHHFHDLVDQDSRGNSLWHSVEARTMKLRNRRKMFKLFGALQVRFVLHGHIHRNEIYERSEIKIANGAGSVCDDPMRYLKYNRLTFADGMCEIETELLPIPFQTAGVTLPLKRSPTGLSQRSLSPLPAL